MISDVSDVNAFLANTTHEASRLLRPLTRASGSSRVDSAEAALEFEAYFLRILLGEMRKTIGEGGLFGDSHARQYTAILDDALARRAAEAGSFGLAKQLLAQMEKTS